MGSDVDKPINIIYKLYKRTFGGFERFNTIKYY